jgi:hypothetical protein
MLVSGIEALIGAEIEARAVPTGGQGAGRTRADRDAEDAAALSDITPSPQAPLTGARPLRR